MYQTHSLAFTGYNMSNDGRKMLGTHESRLNSYRSGKNGGGDKSPQNVTRMSIGGDSLNSAYLM